MKPFLTTDCHSVLLETEPSPPWGWFDAPGKVRG